ncbi:MAG: hypothetical protein ACYDEP_02775 [Acidimicrobiales bacterium]
MIGHVPGVPPAVGGGIVAVPVVVVVTVGVPPGYEPVGSLVGNVTVTGAMGSGFPFEHLTVMAMPEAKRVLTIAD